MKQATLLLLLFLRTFTVAFGQEYSNPRVFESYIPQSPSVAQMSSYVDRPVSLFNGTTSVSIPLCNVDACGITLPLSLSYSYAGLVPSQEASWVGLGWNFSLGACVSRSIKGINDFKKYSGYYIYKGDIPFTAYAKNLLDSCYIDLAQPHPMSSPKIVKDMERDIFFYSIWNGGSKFVLDKNDKDGGCVLFEHSQGWKMTTHKNGKYLLINDLSPAEMPHYFELLSPEGDRYIFDDEELTYVFNYDRTHGEVSSESVYTSSWFLSRIITSKGDTISFEYEQEYYKTVTHISYQKNNYVSEKSIPGQKYFNDFVRLEGEQQSETESSIQTCRLKSIQWRTGRIEFCTSDREDLQKGSKHYQPGCQKLDSIIVLDASNKPVHRFELCHSYFGQNRNDSVYLFKRLRLDRVVDKDDPEFQYSFAYKDGVFPRKDDQGTDYWGFYNGKDYGKKSYCRVADRMTGHIYEGAAKYSDFEKTAIGSLTSIKHPTGGVETFQYELNKFVWLNNLDKPKEVPVLDTTITLNHFREYTDVLTAETTFKVARDVENKITDNAQLNIHCTFTYYEGSTVYRPLFSLYKGDKVIYQREWSRQGVYDYCINLTEGEYRFVAENIPDDWIGVEQIHLTVNQERSPVYYYLADTICGAGLRIASIEGGGKTRKFEYSTGTPLIIPILYHHRAFRWDRSYCRCYCVQVSESTIPLSTLAKGYVVGYRNVAEICGNQRTEYNYYVKTEEPYPYRISDAEGYIPDFFDATDPYVPTKPEFRNGLLLRTEVKGGKERKEETYTYSERKSPLITAITHHGAPGALAHHYQIDWLPLTQKKEVRIEQNGDYFKTTTEYEYNDDFLIRRHTVYNEKNDRYSTEYQYASDLGDVVSIDMRAANMIGFPIKQITYRNGTLCSMSRTEYTTEFNDGMILPKRQLVWNTDSAKYQIVAEVKDYTRYGNPVEVNIQGTPVTYLWGYKGQYPIAEIKNATAKQVGDLLHCQPKSSYLDAMTFGESQLSKIRNLQKQTAGPSAVTTCKFQPMVGVTEITSPIGVKSTYEYDGAGRLSKSIIGAGELHNAYRYHYADGVNPENYVVSLEYLNAAGTDSIATIQYYDAWGRPSMTKAWGANTSGKPLYGLQTYDGMGRPDKSWTPFPSSGTVTEDNFASASALAFDGDQYGYSQTEYDGLGRVVKTTTPGNAWRGKPSETEYTTNGAQEVKLYTITGNRMNKDGYYPAGILTCTQTKDPDGKSIRTYKDLFGNVVLKRRDQDVDTYYVYDDRNRLRYVLQPRYQEVQDLGKFAFYYAYNGRGLVIEKKLPGCEPVRYWYDQADRVVKMQDGLLRADSVYRVYSYDGLGRLTKQSISKDGKKIEYDEIVNFYDNYEYLKDPKYAEIVPRNNVDTTSLCPIHPENGHSQLTGKWQRASNGESMLMSYNYDEYGRLTMTKEIGLDKHLAAMGYSYNFVGDLDYEACDLYRYDKSAGALNDNSLYSWTKHFFHGSNNKLPYRSVIHLTHKGSSNQTNDDIRVLHYDDFGHVVANDRMGRAGDMSYAYDRLHGWLTRSTSASGFSQTLFRESGSDNPRWNGSISAMTWNVGDYVDRTYNYSYDGLSRLVLANYSSTINASGSAAADPEHRSLLPWDCLEENYSESFSYDKNSNIDFIERMGTTNTQKGQEIDALIMEYDGNQLKNVCDFSGESLTYSGAFDFVDRDDVAQEYDYNENGAMTKDVNKGITNIEYDLLGNPRKVTMTNNRSIEYVYAADGRKLRTVHSAPLARSLRDTETKAASGKGIAIPVKPRINIKKTTTDYINNYVFENNKPVMYRFPGGYYSFDEQGNMDGCHFYVQDYQGNNRMVVNAYADTVEQVNHYYSYGALMGDICTQPDKQKYKFGGKELDRKFGLDLNDFHARQQDPLIGRFTAIDPMAEKYYSVSPYVYCAGDPINFIDPTGCDSIFAFKNKELAYIGNDGKNSGDVYLVEGRVKRAVMRAEKKGVNYTGNLKSKKNRYSVAVIPRGETAEQVKKHYEDAGTEEKAGCRYDDGTMDQWTGSSDVDIQTDREGTTTVGHGVNPKLDSSKGSPNLFWHIHTEIDVPVGKGVNVPLGNSEPSPDDYRFESRNNTGSTFVVGKRDNMVQYYHNDCNTIKMTWKTWLRLANLK